MNNTTPIYREQWKSPENTDSYTTFSISTPMEEIRYDFIVSLQSVGVKKFEISTPGRLKFAKKSARLHLSGCVFNLPMVNFVRIIDTEYPVHRIDGPVIEILDPHEDVAKADNIILLHKDSTPTHWTTNFRHVPAFNFPSKPNTINRNPEEDVSICEFDLRYQSFEGDGMIVFKTTRIIPSTFTHCMIGGKRVEIDSFVNDTAFKVRCGEQKEFYRERTIILFKQ